jgi:hypothetical protein
MGDNTLMHKFYKSSQATYSQIQINIDAALYDKYIAAGKCSNILPPFSQDLVMPDGMVYLVIPEFIYIEDGIQTYINELIEITQQEYNQNTSPF